MKLPDRLKRSRPSYVLIVLPDQHKCLECVRDSGWRRFWRAVGRGAGLVVWWLVLATILTLLALSL